MPCARHGWAHTAHVTTTSEWRQRLVKGVVDDFCLAGQKCCCSECRREHKRLLRQQKAAENAGAAPSEIEALKAKAKAATFMFMTYDPRAIHYMFERYPWAAQKLPAFLTHKGAVSTEVLWLLTNYSSGLAGESRSLEGLLTQLRALRASTDQLSFYSFQRAWRRQPSATDSSTPPPVAHLSPGLSSLSAHFLHEILDDFYFHGMERYVPAAVEPLSPRCGLPRASLSLPTIPHPDPTLSLTPP